MKKQETISDATWEDLGKQAKDFLQKLEQDLDLSTKGLLLQEYFGNPIFETEVVFKKDFSESQELRNALTRLEKHYPYLVTNSLIKDLEDDTITCTCPVILSGTYQAKLFPVVRGFNHPYTIVFNQLLFRHLSHDKIGICLGLHGMVNFLEQLNPHFWEKLVEHKIYSPGNTRGSMSESTSNSNTDIREMVRYGGQKPMLSSSAHYYDATLSFSAGGAPYHACIQTLEFEKILRISSSAAAKSTRNGYEVDYSANSEPLFRTSHEKEFEPKDIVLFFFKKD